MKVNYLSVTLQSRGQVASTALATMQLIYCTNDARSLRQCIAAFELRAAEAAHQQAALNRVLVVNAMRARLRTAQEVPNGVCSHAACKAFCKSSLVTTCQLRKHTERIGSGLNTAVIYETIP